MNMTAKEIIQYVPAPDGQTVVSICLSTRCRETVAESMETSIRIWIRKILDGTIRMENGIWSELPWFGTTQGHFTLDEKGTNQAKQVMRELRWDDSRRNDGWRTPSVKTVYRIAKTYRKWGFIPTLAQVKKALENLD